MCKKHNPRKIDECMASSDELATLKTFACCCGHGKYHETIIVEDSKTKEKVEYYSGLVIPRKKRFYVKDKQGYYFIPEVEEYWRTKKNETRTINKR